MVFVLLVHVDVVDDFTVFDCADVVRRDNNVVNPVKPAVALVGVCRSVGFAYGVYR